MPSAASSSSAAAAAANLSNLATFAALANSHAHYGTDLWDAIPAVADQSESAKGYLVRLSKFLKDKAELDKVSPPLHLALHRDADARRMRMGERVQASPEDRHAVE